MINQVIVEGFVTNRSWMYGGDTFFRLASYRDSDLPAKPHSGNGSTGSPRGGNRDAADYFTVRIPTSQSPMPVSVTPRQRLRVHGFLQSRDYQETLADFLKDARGDGLDQVRASLSDGVDPTALAAPRSLTEIVASRIIVLDEPNPAPRKARAGSQEKRAERNAEEN